MSACVLRLVSEQVDHLVFAGEAFGGVGFIPRREVTGGYVDHPSYQHLLSVAEEGRASFFAYDPAQREALEHSELARRWVAVSHHDARDRLAAERLLEAADAGLVFVHVGHRHVDERVRTMSDGKVSSWLAGHLSELSSNSNVLTISQTYPVDRFQDRAFVCDAASGRPSGHSIVLGSELAPQLCIPQSRIGTRWELSDIYIATADDYLERICP